MKVIIKEKNYNITKLYYNKSNTTDSILELDLGKFKYLQYIECKKSYLSKITNLCKYVTYLDCRNNCINELDNLPNFMNTLYCSSNKLKCLDNLPEKLIKLVCAYNKITCLNNLPNELKYLDCSYCYIINLENLPIGLKELICSCDKITNLDFLPESIIRLTIYGYNNNNFSLDLENLPKSIDFINLSYSIISNLYVNKTIWHITNDYYDIKLEKNKNLNINPKPITFCPYPSEFGSNEICNRCKNIIINCKCYQCDCYKCDYYQYDGCYYD